jgi:hypothetical protein
VSCDQPRSPLGTICLVLQLCLSVSDLDNVPQAGKPE